MPVTLQQVILPSFRFLTGAYNKWCILDTQVLTYFTVMLQVCFHSFQWARQQSNRTMRAHCNSRPNWPEWLLGPSKPRVQHHSGTCVPWLSICSIVLVQKINIYIWAAAISGDSWRQEKWCMKPGRPLARHVLDRWETLRSIFCAAGINVLVTAIALWRIGHSSV